MKLLRTLSTARLLVTHASEVAQTIREAFYVARSGRPGPVLVDITKDAQQTTCEFDWEAAAPQLPGYRPDLSPAPKEYDEALELIHNSKRPVILAGHGIIISGAMQEVRDFAERAGIPVAPTLLGLGAFPASHPLNLGMMGAAAATVLTEFCVSAFLLLLLWRAHAEFSSVRQFVRLAIACLVMASVLFALREASPLAMSMVGFVSFVVSALLLGVIPRDDLRVLVGTFNVRASLSSVVTKVYSGRPDS